MNPDEDAYPHWKQFETPAEEVRKAIARLPESFEKVQAVARFRELCYWFMEAHVVAYAGESDVPCSVCGNEERNERTGLLTCECPAPLGRVTP